VLGTPPAFNLSQDQTLHLKISTIIKQEWIQNGSNLLLDILVTRSISPKAHRRESPHKLPAKLLKSTRERCGCGKRAGSIAVGYTPSNK
jgi:hypothetical protein